MDEFINKLYNSLAIAHIGNMGCWLNKTECNELSEYLHSMSSKIIRLSEENTKLTKINEHLTLRRWSDGL